MPAAVAKERMMPTTNYDDWKLDNGETPGAKQLDRDLDRMARINAEFARKSGGMNYRNVVCLDFDCTAVDYPWCYTVADETTYTDTLEEAIEQAIDALYASAAQLQSIRIRIAD